VLDAADASQRHVDEFKIKRLHPQLRIAAELQEVVEVCGEAKAWGVTGQAERAPGPIRVAWWGGVDPRNRERR